MRSCVPCCKRDSSFPRIPLRSTRNAGSMTRRQRALTRYYLDAGAGGLAVGVHTTQFAIRDAGLYEQVLRIAADTAHDWHVGTRPPVLVAGLVGRTDASPRRSRARAAPWLSRRLAEPGGDEGARRGCADRALPRGGPPDPADRLLSAARCRRAAAERCVLDTLCRDRQRRRDQGRALRSLSDARCRARCRVSRAPRTASRSTPATTTTSCSIWSRLSP